MTSPARKSPKTIGPILAVLVLAIVIRLIYLNEYHSSSLWDQLTVDNWYHHHWAQSLAAGNLTGDTTYFRAPLYVYCLGLLYAILGDSLWVGRLFGLVVGLGSLGMTYVLARRFTSPRIAALAAAIQAVMPTVIYFESELLLDPLFMFLLQVAVWRSLIWLDTRQMCDLFLSGLSFGLAAICRPTALAPALVVLIWAISSRRSGGNPLSRATLFLAGTLVCIAPITIRNLAVAHDPVIIASQGGINLYIGNNVRADGLSAVMPEPLGHNWQIAQIKHIAEQETGRRLKPGEVSNYWRDRALDWIKHNPLDFVKLWAKKMAFQLGNREVSNNRSLQSHFSTFPILDKVPVSFALVFPLAFLGAIAMWRRHTGIRMIIFVVAIHAVAVAFFFFSSRFRLPVLPYFCLLAAAGLAWVARQGGKQVGHVAAAATGMVVLGWLSFHPPVSYPDTWSVQGFVTRGLSLYAKGEYSAALEPFRRAAEVRPDFPEVNLNLGATYLRLGQSDSAEACFQREIKLHPLRHKAYQNLASLDLLRGDASTARSLAEKAKTLAPYDVMSNLVWLRSQARDSLLGQNQLISDIEQASRATEEDIDVLNEGAQILVTRDACQAATGFLLRAERSSPPAIETDDQAFGPDFRHGEADLAKSKAVTFYLLGYCYGRMDRLAESLEYSQKAIAADSNLVEAYVNLRSAYLAQGRLLEADSILSEIERRFPGHELIRQMTTPSP